MVLFYSDIITGRLQYTVQFIFAELLHTEYRLSANRNEFDNFNGPKINYSNSASAGFNIKPHQILFETDIKLQQTACFETGGLKAFFKSPGSDFPFDIFAATFYLLSRYEEYLPHTKDMYGRYAHENSLAFKEKFLQLPLINIWVKELAKAVKVKWPTFDIRNSPFKILLTYDIDIAYSYKYKGVLRNIAGFFQKPSLERIRVLTGAQADPFDSYTELHELNKHFEPIYFFLVAQKNRAYDKNILPHRKGLIKLIKTHADKYTMGLHPSWQSGDDKSLLQAEKNLLSNISGKEITQSRQHYIRFTLPETYRNLIETGITDDYSMGYGSINGFRASVASSFFWFDLEKNEQTSLRIHPFCFMEANSFYEQKYSSLKAYDELIYYYKVCKEYNGTLITIWHNNFLGTGEGFQRWKEMYEKFLTGIEF